MIRQFIERHFYHLFLITLFFGVILYGLIGFQSIDELCGGLLLLMFLFHMFNTKDWEINKFFVVVLSVFLFYLCYSFYIHSNSAGGILMDFIIQLKPYLAFFCVYQLMSRFNEKQKIILRQSSVACWALLVPIGILGAINPKIFTMTMAHASNYGAAITALALLFLFTSEDTKRNKWLFIIMLALGITCGRAKFYGFFIIASFIVLYFDRVERTRLSLKNILLFLFIFVAIVFVAKEKIELYFLQGLSDDSEKDYVARFVLYATSFLVFRDYFPFGSGFGSFATFASGAYYSPIYKEYGIDGVWGISKSYHSFISDTYYPSLAQFGVVGVVLFLLFWIYLLKKAFQYLRVTSDMRLMNLAMIVIAFFAIENIADATFTSNRGLYFMMFLGVIYVEMAQKQQARINSKGKEKVEAVKNLA